MDPENLSPGQQAANAPAETEDWEKRFKGLQRTYNKLQSDYEEAQSALTGARTTATNLQQRISELESVRGSDATKYEGELARIKAELETASATSTQYAESISKLEAKLADTERKAEVRKVLSDADSPYRNLLPLYDAGVLSVEQDEVGQVNTAKLDEAMKVLGSQFTADFQRAMSGTTPSIPNQGTSPVEGANTVQLGQWLNNPANFDSPSYEEVNEQYLSAIESSQRI